MDGADADFVKALEKILGEVSTESRMSSGSESRGGVQGWRQAAGMTELTSATSIGFLISWVRKSAILTVCRDGVVKKGFSFVVMQRQLAGALCIYSRAMTKLLRDFTR